MPRKSARRLAIERRVIEAMKRLVAYGAEPRAILLNDEDFRALTQTHPRMKEPIEIDGIPVREGAWSRLWSTRGVGFHL